MGFMCNVGRVNAFDAAFSHCKSHFVVKDVRSKTGIKSEWPSKPSKRTKKFSVLKSEYSGVLYNTPLLIIIKAEFKPEVWAQ